VAPFAQDLVLREDAHDSADRRTDEDAGASRVHAVHVRVRPRLARSGDREHDVALQPPRILRAHHGLRVEALHLRRNPYGISGRVERLDPVHPAPSCDSLVPGRLRVEPERSDGAEAGDSNATHDVESVVA